MLCARRNSKHCCYCNASRWQRVLRTSQCCQRKSLLRLDRPNARWPCTKGWRWPSTPWTNLKSVLLVKISLSLSTFVFSVTLLHTHANAKTKLYLEGHDAYIVIQKFSSCLKTLMLMNALLPKRTKRRERIEEEKTKKIREVVKLARL